MSDVFIPPEGAMQFVTDKHPMPKFRDVELWVKPISNKPQGILREKIGCECQVFYEILQCDDPSVWNGQWTVVCTCLGRIIE